MNYGSPNGLNNFSFIKFQEWKCANEATPSQGGLVIKSILVRYKRTKNSCPEIYTGRPTDLLLSFEL